ncbi:DEAD/DEAH box helicase, partial [Streptomyces sp. SID10362]|nr:DEAD/DEAH box helicase [Streptomyces sp. SID10362]
RYGSLTAAARPASRTGPPTVAGRWSLLPEREADGTVRAHALARTMLDRHGVVTRGAVAAEGVEGGFSAVYRILAAFEESGQARRGYVVEGLGAAQFAMEGAVDRLRAVANARERGDDSPPPAGSTSGAFGPGQPTGGPAGPVAGSPFAPSDPSDPFDPFGDSGHVGDSGDFRDFASGGGPGAPDPTGGSVPDRREGPGGRPAPAGPPDDFDDVFADPDGLGRSPSRGDYISPRDYAEPGSGGPRGGHGHGGYEGSRGPYDTGLPGRRDRTPAGPRAVVLAAADPANAYGAALGWPEPPAGATHKPGRKAGSLVVLVGGEPALYVERGGKTLLLWPSDPDRLPTEDPGLRAAAQALAEAARAGSLGTVTVERVNGAAALTSPFGPLLEGAGFVATPRGLRIRA